MHHAVFDLQLAGDAEKAHRLRQHRVALEDAFPNHHIDETGFVLQRHEHHAAGGARPLPADHQAGVTNGCTVRHRRHSARIGHTLAGSNPGAAAPADGAARCALSAGSPNQLLRSRSRDQTQDSFLAPTSSTIDRASEPIGAPPTRRCAALRPNCQTPPLPPARIKLPSSSRVRRTKSSRDTNSLRLPRCFDFLPVRLAQTFDIAQPHAEGEAAGTFMRNAPACNPSRWFGHRWSEPRRDGAWRLRRWSPACKNPSAGR